MPLLAGLLVLSLFNRATAQSLYTVTVNSAGDSCQACTGINYTASSSEPLESASSPCTLGGAVWSGAASAKSGELYAEAAIDWVVGVGPCAKASGFARCEINDLVFTGPPGAPPPLVSWTLEVDALQALGIASWSMTGTGFGCVGCSGSSCCGSTVALVEITSSPVQVTLSSPQTFSYDLSVSVLALDGVASPVGKAYLRFANSEVFNLPPGYTVNSVSAGIVNNHLGGDPTWMDLGSGLAGIAGEPSLTGTGTLLDGTPTNLALSNANPSSLTLLFASVSSTPAPFKGGLLVPVPVLIEILSSTQLDGTLALPFLWPSGLPSATSLWFQYAVSDLAAVKKVALSNAVKATTP